jgi:hypothetical protein
MQKVSSAIFEWDLGDDEMLRTAKKSELKKWACRSHPLSLSIKQSINKI